MPIAGSTSCSFLVNFRIKQVAMNIMLSVRLVALMVFEFAIFVPDSVDYGAQNAPVAKYGNVSVIIGDTTKLTRKIERLKAIMPSLEGQSGTLHLESWTEETTNIVFDKSE
jgi:hypothetical protein